MINNETKRALIGWAEINPVNLLTGSNPQTVTAEHTERVQHAINTKNAREPFVNPINVISDPPAGLQEYITGFWQQPNIEVFVQEGWVIKMADLNKVCTIQPLVENKKSIERVKNVDPNNLIILAQITLPYTIPQVFPGAFDQNKNAFIFSSPNPNLRIAGTVQQNGVFGFLVTITNSFVQVVKCQGRYFMRDGHHRTYGLLSKNISTIPVLYREYNSFVEMGIPQGLFPTEVLTSNRPPMLKDYFDDNVSSEALFPISAKVVMIQGIELNTIS